MESFRANMDSSGCSSLKSSVDSRSCCSLFNFSRQDLVKSGFYRMKRFQDMVCCGCGWSSNECNVTIRHLNFIHKIHNPDCEMSNYMPEDIRGYLDQKRSIKNTEDMMKETFLFWPKSFPSIEDLVKSGFYYTGCDDRVECLVCSVIISDWKEGDDPTGRHLRSSPYCELLKTRLV